MLPRTNLHNGFLFYFCLESRGKKGGGGLDQGGCCQGPSIRWPCILMSRLVMQVPCIGSLNRFPCGKIVGEKHSLPSAAYGGSRKWRVADPAVWSFGSSRGSSAGSRHCPTENNEDCCLSEAINPGGLPGKTERSQEWNVNSSETHPREDCKELFEAPGRDLRPMLCHDASAREI